MKLEFKKKGKMDENWELKFKIQIPQEIRLEYANH